MSDEDKYRIARVELVHICPHSGNFEGQELEFNYTLRILALHVVGSHALPLDRRATAACSARRICNCVCADGSDLEVDARLQPKAAYAGSGGGQAVLSRRNGEI